MKKYLLTTLILAIVQSVCFAQETFLVKGKVTDKTGEPLIGASVVLKPLNLGAASDMNGNYSFNVPSSLAKRQSGELIASYVNYKKSVYKATIDGTNITHNFMLEDDVFQNEEIVVTGIASKTSKSVAEVAVSHINVMDLTAKQGYSSLSQLITGKMAGVNIQTSSGNVSSGWRFFVRSGGGLNGNEQPVIYIDGARVDQTEYYGASMTAGYGQPISILANMNPNDIENIEVLKGPSAAAMYGTSGSNGVVLITTKHGRNVQGLAKNINVNYQFNYGYNEPSFTYKDDWLNSKTINSVLSPKGLIQEHSLSLTGGGGMLKYFTSFQSRKEQGIIPSQNYMDRKNIRLNLTAVPNENLSIQVNTSYIWNKISRPPNDNNTWGWMLNALSYWPAFLNLDSVSVAAQQDITDLDQFIGSGKISWKPISNLEISGSFGLDYSHWNSDYYAPWGFDFAGETRGFRSVYTRDAKRFTYDINARYTFNLFEKMDITSIVGAQLLDRKGKTLNVDVSYFNHPNITILGAALEKTAVANSYTYGREAGIFWENNFNWDNTYFWTLALRRDYANSFGSEAPAITYPKASLAIRLDKFGILPSEIEMLKLRTSYGESGQLPGRLDGIDLTWTATLGANGVGVVGNSLGNPAIEPERIKEFEVGFDTEFLKIFSLEFSYYKQDAEKSIVYSTLAPSTGFGTVLTYPFNVGRVKSHGFESLLQITPIRTPETELSFSFIWNYQTSEVLDLGNSAEIYSDQNVIKVGFKKHEFYAQKTLGPTFDPVTQKYNGLTATPTKVDCGNPIPDHSGSFSINFRFLKNFTLYAFAEYGFNNYVYSYTKYRAIRAGSFKPYNDLRAQLGLTAGTAGIGALTPGTTEYIEAAKSYASMNTSYQGNFILPADYFALRELSLSYDFSDLLKEYLSNSFLTNVTTGFSIRNVFRASKYELDYEANYSGGTNYNTFQSDLGTLPQPRTYNFWVRLGF